MAALFKVRVLIDYDPFGGLPEDQADLNCEEVYVVAQGFDHAAQTAISYAGKLSAEESGETSPHGQPCVVSIAQLADDGPAYGRLVVAVSQSHRAGQ